LEEDSDSETTKSGAPSKNGLSRLSHISRLQMRAQYCFKTKTYLEDDEDLRNEGFIVPDDEFSEHSSLDENEGESRKELIR